MVWEPLPWKPTNTLDKRVVLLRMLNVDVKEVNAGHGAPAETPDLAEDWEASV